MAGSGTYGFFGDGGPTTSAGIKQAYGLATDPSGTLFIADSCNERIRRVSHGGIISTIAGTGAIGYSGDDGPALAATLYFRFDISIDGSGKVYVVESSNSVIRLLTPTGPAPVISAVTNGASNLSGPISPGEIVVIKGVGLGPSQPVWYNVTNGILDKQLAGTQVLFNGTAAPLVYTSATQVAALVPYEVAGSLAQVMVTYQNQPTDSVAVSMVSAAPGIFTLDSTGQGAAAGN